jgi:polysaccharide biosynthesis protein PslH
VNNRLLVLLNRIPYPLDDGWKVRTFHLLRAAVRSGPATIVSYGEDPDGEFMRALGGHARLRTVPSHPRHTPWQLLRGLIGPLPLYAYLDNSPAYRALVREEVNRGVDVVLCELTALFECLRGLAVEDRTVIDTHNIDSLVFDRYATTQPTLPRRLYSRVTARKLRRYEADVFARVARVVVCSDAEVAPVLERAPGARCRVIPNGAEMAIPARTVCRPDGRRLFFFGRLDYHPNVDGIRYFLGSIFPLILRERPDAEFHVAGAGDNGTVAELLAGVPQARFHGRVADLRTEIERADVVVVPLRAGGGTRLKILEALAASRPVVSTSIGAEGLALHDGDEIILADPPAQFAAAVSRLLAEPGAAERIGALGRRAVERAYGWDAIGQRLADVLLEVANAHRPPQVGS